MTRLTCHYNSFESICRRNYFDNLDLHLFVPMLSVATSSGLVTSSSAIEERADEYARDNFVLDNTVVSLCLGTVNIAAIVTFYLLSR